MIAIKLIGINSFKTEVLKVRMDEITIGQVIRGECGITLSKLATRQSEAVSSLLITEYWCGYDIMLTWPNLSAVNITEWSEWLNKWRNEQVNENRID